MSYVALYRKYRPVDFSSISGQENVVNILKKQVENLKISHAYIFSGTRGTGKTSAAKIFARAINCLDPQNGEPCNKCKACISILDGESTDVVEMDAASNNSVENIRQIRTEVMYVATNVKYRVYIIDEVHMLTTSAFNALLKTLEEPPENVVFILATTEQHKIPVTILSRCLRFEFSKITAEDIKERLKFVLGSENITYEEEALEYIAKKADGALRDALSILDRCLSEDNQSLSLKVVESITGSIDRDIIINITQALVKNSVKDVLSNLEILEKKSKDLRQLVYEIMEQVLDILISAKDDDSNVELYSNIISELSKLDTEIRMSTKPNVIVKSALIRIANLKKIDIDENINSTASNNYSNIDIERINTLESKIEKLEASVGNKNITIQNNIKNNSDDDTNENTNLKPNVKKEVSSTSKIFDINNFKKILPTMGKLKLFSSLSSASIEVLDDKVKVYTTNSFAYKVLTLEEQRQDIAMVLNKHFGINLPVVIELKQENNVSKMEKVLKDNNIEYTDID